MKTWNRPKIDVISWFAILVVIVKSPFFAREFVKNAIFHREIVMLTLYFSQSIFRCLYLVIYYIKSWNQLFCGVKTLNAPYIDGILPKGPYPPGLRMADRVLVAGYPRYFISTLPPHPPPPHPPTPTPTPPHPPPPHPTPHPVLVFSSVPWLYMLKVTGYFREPHHWKSVGLPTVVTSLLAHLSYRIIICKCINHAPAFYRARWLVKVTRHV